MMSRVVTANLHSLTPVHKIVIRINKIEIEVINKQKWCSELKMNKTEKAAAAGICRIPFVLVSAIPNSFHAGWFDSFH